MVKMITLNSRNDWLEFRNGKIGGSDCASILGLNPWKTNVDLYYEKIGQAEPEDISDKPIIKYGNNAEPLLRELFKLDFPQWQILYEENNAWINTDYPFAHASLDGWIIDENGRKGIFECKTSTIQSSTQNDKWKDKIPDNYYCQILHYLLVTGFDFVILKAQLKRELFGELIITTKHYTIERSDVLEDIELLKHAETEFYESMKNKTKPSLILPEL